MTRKAISFALLTASLMLTPSSEAKSFTSIDELPQILLQRLSRARTVEEYTSQVTQMLPRDLTTEGRLTKAYVEQLKLNSVAQQRASQIQQALTADLNADNKVTREEITQYSKAARSRMSNRMNQYFEKLDKNKDGTLDFVEISTLDTTNTRSYRPTAQLEQLLALDPNNNDEITLNELRDIAKNAFSLIDEDKDGLISEAEKNNMHYAQQSARQKAQLRPTNVQQITIGDDTEIQVAGLYEGYTKTDGKTHGPLANVYVDRPGKKVALFLTSYEGVMWRVSLSKGTTLENIYINNYGQPKSQVMLENEPYEKAITVEKMPYNYQAKGQKFRTLLSVIQSATGRKGIDGFVGEYRAPSEWLKLSKGADANPDLQVDRLKPADPSTLPDLTFQTTIKGVSGLYNLSGKLIEKTAASNRLRGQNYAYVPQEEAYYAIGGRGLRKLSSDGDTIEEIAVSLDVPRFSHPRGIAYNSKENKIVVVSLGGVGYLYGYDLNNKKWEVIADMKNRDYGKLSYDAENNQYIASPSGITSRGNSVDIHYIKANGSAGKSISIPTDQLAGYNDLYDIGNGPAPSTQVIVKGDKAILLVSGSRHMGSSGVARIYLYDMNTKKATLTWAPSE